MDELVLPVVVVGLFTAVGIVGALIVLFGGDKPSRGTGATAIAWTAIAIGAVASLVVVVSMVNAGRDGDTTSISASSSTSSAAASSSTAAVPPAPSLAPPRPTADAEPPPSTAALPARCSPTGLLCLTMPSGSRLTRGPTAGATQGPFSDSQEEDWQSGTDFERTVAALQPQLPIGSALQGSPWCVEDYHQPTRMLSWVWGGTTGTPQIIVEINPQIGDPTRAVVFITVEHRAEVPCVR